MDLLPLDSASDVAKEAIANADAYLNNAGLATYSTLRAALEQIERLAREGTYEGQVIRDSIREIAARTLRL